MCWPLQGTSRYLFAANQQAIKKKNISFSVPFVGMNFTKDSLCNVNRLKYNSLTIFWGNLIWGWWFQILRGPCPLFSQGVQISCTELVSCELHMTLNLTRNTICIYLNLIDRNWKKKNILQTSLSLPSPFITSVHDCEISLPYEKCQNHY